MTRKMRSKKAETYASTAPRRLLSSLVNFILFSRGKPSHRSVFENTLWTLCWLGNSFVYWWKFIAVTWRLILFQYRVPSDDEDLATSQMIQQFYDCLIQSIDAVKAWADRVPGFSELCKHDQEQLFEPAALELVMLRIAYNCRYRWFYLRIYVHPIIVIE